MMNTDEDLKKVIDKEKIKSAVRLWLPISITTYTLPRSMEMYMQDVLSVFLKECHQEEMTSYLSYCLGELVTNAKKANTKRVYFKEKGLDITIEDDYNRGMESFKQDTLQNIGYWLQLQKKAGLYVRLVLQEYRDKIKIEIHNNADLTVFEYKRIHDKLARAQKYQSVEEVLNKILDDSEGAGLGIVIIILMLEKIGLTEENYQVLSENGETITRIILPVNQITKQAILRLTEKYVSSISTIPVFPSKLDEVIKMLDTPDVTTPMLSKKISKDVSLSLLVMEFINKDMGVHCSSLPKALEIIGIDRLREIFNNKNPKIRFISPLEDEYNLWEHSARIAFFAYNLARNLAAEDAVSAEEIYISGLFHDIGRIMYTTASQNEISIVEDFCTQERFQLSVLEAIKSGFNHSYMGSLICKKFSLPQNIYNAVLYHHDPLYSPREHSKAVAIIYIADMMARYMEHSVDFYQIDRTILRQFNIITEEKFRRIATKAEEAFLKSI